MYVYSLSCICICMYQEIEKQTSVHKETTYSWPLEFLFNVKLWHGIIQTNKHFVLNIMHLQKEIRQGEKTCLIQPIHVHLQNAQVHVPRGRMVRKEGREMGWKRRSVIKAHLFSRGRGVVTYPLIYLISTKWHPLHIPRAKTAPLSYTSRINQFNS